MQQEKSKLSKKIDSICRALFLTEEGKPKSASLLYSFCLGLLFFGIYFAVDIVCVLYLNDLFTEATWWGNALQYTLPGVITGALCVCLVFPFREPENKKLVPSAFIWLCGLTLVITIAMMFFCSPDDWWAEYSLFLLILILPWCVFLAVGTVGSRWLVRRFMARKAKQAPIVPKRRSYYDT